MLTLLGSGIASATIVGSGAFNITSAERDVTVEVVPDTDAYLSIESIGSGGRSSEGDSLGANTVQFRFPGPDFGEHPEGLTPGLGTDSIYEFTRDKNPDNPEGLAIVTNQGTQTVEVTCDQEETNGPKVGLFDIDQEPLSDGLRPLLREDPIPLSPGESFRIGIQINTHGVEIGNGSGPDGEYVESVRFVASAEGL